MKKGDMDADNTTIGRINLQLKAGEVSRLIVAPFLEEALTTIKLNETDFGYKYEFIE